MATKTISIEIDVYEKLKSLRISPSESFSQVLRRELRIVHGLPAREILRRAKRPGGFLGMREDQIREVEAVRESLKEWNDPKSS